ncbi:MAG: DUF4405 domain-containing protein [Candidatus Omnitrophica bacterium]|nr:DUF4405 domain-containing protein [Candidatus Omnitrophota bacterium]MDD4940697.1 DUF4405 domain-containing protein [Candidatus Omnitrophota bacterium]MDD5775984.1 DUF4405 domain-containing protein [Candidatus Omnitrophota bacterium]HNQ50667.1 DUF4405 domain-containing protein [Candidatus Omnitrophota bacterium]HQO37470.1 DUF4405 domain-containing protein [Candidatus Omnitrophota bacterium]
MDKTKALVAVNAVLFAAASIQVISGFMLILTGSPAAYRVHKYNAAFFPVILIVHLALNWGWVKAVVLKRR